MTARCTVLITTLNRRDMLVRAIDSVIAQDEPADVLIVDDGSTDGTSDMLADRYPGLRVLRNKEPLGIIAARNRAAALVGTPFLLTLDDDAVLGSRDTLRRAADAMAHPRVGVAALPLRNHLEDRIKVTGVSTRADDPDFPIAFTYPGGANLMRVDLFRAMGGYGGSGRQGEESTFAIRLLARGMVVRLAPVPPVDHYPQRGPRDWRGIALHQAHNELLYAWAHVPTVHLPVALARTTANAVRVGWRVGATASAVRGLFTGAGTILRGRQARSPVPRKVYSLSRALARAGETPLSAAEPHLPPIDQTGPTRPAEGAT